MSAKIVFIVLFLIILMMILIPVILVIIFTGLIGNSVSSRWDIIIIALMTTLVLMVAKIKQRTKPATDTDDVLREIHSASV